MINSFFLIFVRKFPYRSSGRMVDSILFIHPSHLLFLNIYMIHALQETTVELKQNFTFAGRNVKKKVIWMGWKLKQTSFSVALVHVFRKDVANEFCRSGGCKRIMTFGEARKNGPQFLNHFRTKIVTNNLVAPWSKSLKTRQDNYNGRKKLQ